MSDDDVDRADVAVGLHADFAQSISRRLRQLDRPGGAGQHDQHRELGQLRRSAGDDDVDQTQVRVTAVRDRNAGRARAGVDGEACIGLRARLLVERARDDDKRSVTILMMAMIIVMLGWMGTTLVVRAQVLTMKERQFVAVANLSTGVAGALTLIIRLATLWFATLLGICGLLLVQRLLGDASLEPDEPQQTASK